MPPWLEPLISVLSKYQAEIRRFLKVLTKQPVALAISATLLVASVLLTFLYWQRSARYEAVVTSTIGSTMEATAQENKGLEAFIFSNVRKHVDDAVRTAPLNPKFIKQYHQFHEAVQASLPNKTAAKQSGSKTADNQTDIILTIPKNSNHQVLSDPDQKYSGFLFLPTFLLHTSLSADEVQRLIDGAPLVLRAGPVSANSQADKQAVYLEDRGIATAVALTRALATNIQALADQPVIAPDVDTEATRYLNRHPAQVYIITKEGLNRVFTQGQAHPANEFGNQFPPNTFFPSRPYFWPAVQEQESGARQKTEPVVGDSIGTFFHVSKPYLDLGGSGVVITLSRALELDDMTTAVICFDLQFDVSQNLYTALENNVRDLSGTPLEVDCTIPTNGDPECEGHHGDANAKQFSDQELGLVKKVKDRLGESKEDYARSKVLGTLSRFDESESKASPSRVIFSLPMDRKFLPDGTQKAKLLVVDLDVNEYKKTTTLIALAAASCFGLTTVVLAYLWGSNMMRRKEFETSFGRMAEVMYNSPTPYLRLDSNDQISDVSESFCALVGVPSTPESISELKKKTFKSFLADQASLSEYERVEAARNRREHVAPYVLTLRKSNGSQTAVRVISAAVPATEEEKLPQTFGILVELGRPSPVQVEVPEQMSPEQNPSKVM